MNDNVNRIYRELQQLLDKLMPLNYPVTESGVEIRLLKHLFTPEEAKLALSLRDLPEPLERVHQRVKKNGISIQELEKKLDFLVEKGAINGRKLIAGKKNEKVYSLHQFSVGMFESQVDRLTKEYFKDSYEYFVGTYYKEFHRTDTPSQMRTIPVEKSISTELHVRTYDDIRQLIENMEGSIAVTKCICRSGMDLLDKPCVHTDLRETCIQLGKHAEVFIERGSARSVTKEELFQLLDEFEEDGLILQPENTQNPSVIHACCGDCCFNLTQLKRFPRPAEFFESNYSVEVDSEKCRGCRTCTDRCQMQAVIRVDRLVTVDLDRCSGCGNCVAYCLSKAIQLKKKEKEKVPPEDLSALRQKIMLKKIGN
jgi:NAD-dependent dihydropyrimidine dehydrogenase PreA subunit